MMRCLAAVLLPALLAASAAAAAPAPSSHGGHTTGDPGRRAAIHQRSPACLSLERPPPGPSPCGRLGSQSGAVPAARCSHSSPRAAGHVLSVAELRPLLPAPPEAGHG